MRLPIPPPGLIVLLFLRSVVALSKTICKILITHNQSTALVPRRGLEPPRLAALVPETSASTNSATWALAKSTLNNLFFSEFFSQLGEVLHRISLNLVPRRGLEPPRLSALVPETSASTNSATWAFQERFEL